MLELIVAVDMLGQRVPSAVSSSILRALLVERYDTMEQAMAVALAYEPRVVESSDGDNDSQLSCQYGCDYGCGCGRYGW